MHVKTPLQFTVDLVAIRPVKMKRDQKSETFLSKIYILYGHKLLINMPYKCLFFTCGV